jgi:hypothetical protein
MSVQAGIRIAESSRSGRKPREKNGMSLIRKTLTLCIAIAIPVWAGDASTKKEPKNARDNAESARSAVMWVSPDDVRTRNLFYGSGGEKRQPHGTTFTFEKEDMNGTNPKLDVRDSDGVKWKLKLGTEARPETTASRFVWAAGYFTTDDYLVKDARIEELPSRLHRGRNLIGPRGEVHYVRLKRNPEGYEKTGIWSWKRNSLDGTRELNGLRVMMALINNWDVKDENNGVLEKKSADRSGPDVIYYASDLGSSFGTTHLGPHHVERKGDLDWFERSRFVTHISPEYVDLSTPGRPSIFFFFDLKEYFMRVRLDWIGKRIPREDARWIGGILARLSHQQICDAFRAGGFPPDQIEAFAAVIEQRIDALNRL